MSVILLPRCLGKIVLLDASTCIHCKTSAAAVCALLLTVVVEGGELLLICSHCNRHPGELSLVLYIVIVYTLSVARYLYIHSRCTKNRKIEGKKGALKLTMTARWHQEKPKQETLEKERVMWEINNACGSATTDGTGSNSDKRIIADGILGHSTYWN